MNNFINYILFSILLIFLGTSCKNNESKKKQDTSHFNDSTETKNRTLKILLNNTDFIKNRFGYGKLVYDIRQDTLTPNDIEKKFILIAVSGNSTASTFESVIKTADDVILDSTSTDEIEFKFKVKFSEIGEQELKIAIKEYTELKMKDSFSELIDVIESDTIFTTPVFVIDSTSVLGYKGDTAYYVGKRTIKLKRKDSARYAKENQRKIDSMKRVLNNQ